jgi:precorrin-2/cobalt-factor-2 C20-methyltransferase
MSEEDFMDEEDKGMLVCVGTGPGDPGLVTLAAVREVQQADVVCCPVSNVGSDSIAAHIMAKATGIDPSTWIHLHFPMTHDHVILDQAWGESCGIVSGYLDNGFRVVFLVLGDPSLYGSWQYLSQYIRTERPVAVQKIVPGITAVSAFCARIQVPLAIGNERFSVVPMPEEPGELEPLLEKSDSVVIYKVGGRLQRLAQWAQSQDLSVALAGSRIGMDGEIIGALSKIAEETDDYFSLVLLKKNRTLNPKRSDL